MTDDFCLSDKIKDYGYVDTPYSITVKDVKEFIKREITRRENQIKAFYLSLGESVEVQGLKEALEKFKNEAGEKLTK